MIGPSRSRRAAIAVGCLGLSLAVVPVDARAATLCVNPGGTGGCFASIQAAVDAAVSRDTVEVAAGTYIGQVGIGPRKGALTLNGAGQGQTIIDPPGPIQSALWITGGGTRPTISNLTLTGGREGAIVDVNATATFVDVEFTANEVGFLARGGKATLLRCNSIGNEDYGVHVFQSSAYLTMTDSTVSGNGLDGVRIEAGGRAKIVSSTISGNGAIGVGTGLAMIYSSTITNNALGLSVVRRATLQATIVADNGPFGDCQTSPGALVRVSGPSLIEDVGTCALAAPPGTLLTGDPMLGPLQDNGGTTETHALLPGSPAIGAITRRALCKRPDQRGVVRGTPCDVGAFEAP